MPVLGERYQQVLEQGQLRVECQQRQFILRYFDHVFPLTPDSLTDLLSAAQSPALGAPALGAPASLPALRRSPTSLAGKPPLADADLIEPGPAGNTGAKRGASLPQPRTPPTQAPQHR